MDRTITISNLTDQFDIAKDQRKPTKLRYGIDYLDKATGGIRDNDLILIGGRSGSGKTELASLIAQNNCENHNVYVFSLESEPAEMTNRILFRRFVLTYRAKGGREPIYYRDWIEGRLNGFTDVLDSIEFQAMTKLGKLFIIERTGFFGIEEFEQTIEEIQTEAGLIIVDHLHHFDTDDDNEVRHLKKVVKRIRDLCLLYNKPIILIAHFRKADRKSAQLVPDMEEFHGSSEATKEATVVITLSHYEEPEKKEEDNSRAYQYWTQKEKDNADQGVCLHPTLFKVCKLRKDPIAKFVGLMYFNSRNNSYEEGFTVHKLDEGGKELVNLDEHKYPHWAREDKRLLSPLKITTNWKDQVKKVNPLVLFPSDDNNIKQCQINEKELNKNS